MGSITRLYETIDEACQRTGITKKFFYNNSKMFDPAKVRFAGKIVKPILLDPSKVDRLFSVGAPTGSLKTRQGLKKPNSLSSMKRRKG